MIAKLTKYFRDHPATAIIAAIAVGGILLALTLVGLPNGHSTNNQPAFPAAAIRQIKGFTFYYLKPGFSTDFVLQPKSVTYRSGVLVFEMVNRVGKTLAFTEEATPPNFDPSSLQTTSQSNTEFGSTVVTANADRTSGALFSVDKTWVVINAPDPIGGTLMQQILNALQPHAPIK